jgi:hypothetical protein
MTFEVRTVIVLRERIDALRLEQPLTRAGRESRDETIADLEGQIRMVVAGHIPRHDAVNTFHVGEL